MVADVIATIGTSVVVDVVFLKRVVCFAQPTFIYALSGLLFFWAFLGNAAFALGLDDTLE